jgi:hypothetical protein
VVIRPSFPHSVFTRDSEFKARKNYSPFFRACSACMCLVFFMSACGTTDQARIKESRDAYLKNDFAKSEAALYTPEVFKNPENRLEHYYFLSSIAMSEGLYEKAVYFLDKARDVANQVRSSSGTFEWFSKDYKSNPIEYSYIHYMLVMSYELLAEAGQTPAWSTPLIKDDKGNVTVDAQTHPAQTFDNREIADFRSKARSELLAWDSFLETLKRTYPDQDYYKEDVWARVLASYLHGVSTDDNERRTSELLSDQAGKILEHEFNRYPSAKTQDDQIQSLLDRLKKRAQGQQRPDTLFVLEAGVIAKYKVKRFHLGLSTLFSNIKDPKTRRLMEMVGLQVLLNTAPEFGLIAAGGAVAGAVSGSSDDDEDGPPQYFSDAVDRSFGFEIRFPTMVFPPADTRVKLSLTAPGLASQDYALPVVSPLQEMVATELKNRESGEMFAKALTIGSEYLAVLIPAVIAYRNAGRNGNVFQKLAILAGYFLAKKAIDNANNPDLRSWDLLPELIAANLISTAPGIYDAKVTIDNHNGRDERNLGQVMIGSPSSFLLRQRIGDVPILDARGMGRAHAFEQPPHVH